jgi:hypothetical protein
LHEFTQNLLSFFHSLFVPLSDRSNWKLSIWAIAMSLKDYLAGFLFIRSVDNPAYDATDATDATDAEISHSTTNGIWNRTHNGWHRRQAVQV